MNLPSNPDLFIFVVRQEGVEQLCHWLQEASQGPLMRAKEFAAKEMVLQGNQVIRFE